MFKGVYLNQLKLAQIIIHLTDAVKFRISTSNFCKLFEIAHSLVDVMTLHFILRILMS